MSTANRGFASLIKTDAGRARQKEIASLGGQAASRAGGHKWTPEEAAEAGRRGGRSRWAKRQAETSPPQES